MTEQESDGGPEEESLTIGEREQVDAYTDFRKELEALPKAAEFQALVVKYGQSFGYRTVGRWIAGRAPKTKRKT